MPIIITLDDLARIELITADHDKDRFEIQKDTFDILQRKPDELAGYKRAAEENLAQWKQQSATADRARKVRVMSGDWGDVTLQASKETGHTYAVLNMANAYSVGGGYLRGAIAQEENIYRRSDCHNYIEQDEVKEINIAAGRMLYTEEMTHLINAQHGKVYLDAEHARVCFRGPEIPGDPAASYLKLSKENCFLFYEMKSAAVDLRQRAGTSDDRESMRLKIEAQLFTLIKHGIRHVVLGAFGCGAFRNPPQEVALLYQEALKQYGAYFDDVVFAVYDGAYGPKNYPVFADSLNNMPLPESHILDTKNLNDFETTLQELNNYLNEAYSKDCPDSYTKIEKKLLLFDRKEVSINTGFKQIRDILEKAGMPLELKVQTILNICTSQNRKNEPKGYHQHYKAIQNIINTNLLLDWEQVEADEDKSSPPSPDM